MTPNPFGNMFKLLVWQVDDICIFAQGNRPEEKAHLLNTDLAKISDWAHKWKVNFNPSKTKNTVFITI